MNRTAFDQPNVMRSVTTTIKIIKPNNSSTNSAPKPMFAAAEKLLARDIRNDATNPNTTASNAARTMINQPPTLAMSKIADSCWPP
jgi:hypothetical protein